MREKYRVSPAGMGWEVKEDGSPRREVFRKKVGAVRKGRQLAKVSELGRLITYTRKGRTQTEHRYGKDPRRRKG
jgi:hypothetical protein